MSTLKVNTIQNTSGVEVYTAKAWVNFNGTGAVAIRASGNVSSITDNGTGNYTVTFTTAMPDANYAPVFIAGTSGAGVTSDLSGENEVATTGFDVRTRVAGGSALTNADTVAVAVFR